MKYYKLIGHLGCYDLDHGHIYPEDYQTILCKNFKGLLKTYKEMFIEVNPVKNLKDNSLCNKCEPPKDLIECMEINNYRMTKQDLLKACKANDYITLRDSYNLYAINCKIALLGLQRKKGRYINEKTPFIGFQKVNLNEYINHKLRLCIY